MNAMCGWYTRNRYRSEIYNSNPNGQSLAWHFTPGANVLEDVTISLHNSFV